MKRKSYRKIIVGDNFANSIRYIKDATYSTGTTKSTICSIIDSDIDPNEIQIWATDGTSQFLWHEIAKKTILDKEQDVNFE